MLAKGINGILTILQTVVSLFTTINLDWTIANSGKPFYHNQSRWNYGKAIFPDYFDKHCRKYAIGVVQLSLHFQMFTLDTFSTLGLGQHSHNKAIFNQQSCSMKHTHSWTLNQNIHSKTLLKRCTDLQSQNASFGRNFLLLIPSGSSSFLSGAQCQGHLKPH